MASPTLSLVPVAPAPLPALPTRRRLGDLLVRRGCLDRDALDAALARQKDIEAHLGEILRIEGALSEEDVLAALEVQWGARRIDLRAEPPDPDLISEIGFDHCLTTRCVPWRRIGAVVVIAAVYPARYEEMREKYEAQFGQTMLALVTEGELTDSLARTFPHETFRRTERRVPAELSCRDRPADRMLSGYVLPAAVPILLWWLLSPASAMLATTVLALAALVILSGLKAAACVAVCRRAPPVAASSVVPMPPRSPSRLPVVSLIVPLYHEQRIAQRLVARLARLRYPKPLLDICITVEAGDTVTRAALDRTALPPEMRVLIVPEGVVKTKPRALNFALDHCRGSIVGVYDAEDAPHPDQICDMVAQFQTASPDVACLQGRLSFYNSRQNWLSRCFAIDYAIWFEVVLPGAARMSLPIPLGGTTLFFRRKVLDSLGAWDAHNVTEDADLGIRLARRGYRTELLDSTTEEEANARLWPWVRQRSRWLKGYAMTYATHMRRPRLMWREIGPRGFAGFQIMFAVTLLQVLLAPVLWTWLALPFVPAHPLHHVVGSGLFWVATGLMVSAEAVNLTLAAVALRRRRQWRLLPWALTLNPYMMLASVALLKALIEIAIRPFFWDKTEHGVAEDARPRAVIPVPAPG